MKTIQLIVVLLITMGFTAQSQDQYHVTRVNGKVTNLKTNQEVAAGDVLNASDQLLFETIDSYAIAIGANMGRFQIKIQEQEGGAPQPMLTATVAEAARPTKMRNLMMARFNPNESEIADLKQYFGNDKFSIIGDEVNIPLSEQNYRLSDDNFIVFYYRVDNNPVQKKIGFEEQKLILEKEKLVNSSIGAISGDEITDLQVYEYEASTRTGREITRFTLVFVDKESLKNEFYTIIPILKRQQMADPDIKKYLIEYYYDFYGATDSKTIDTFADEVVKNYTM
ncbi:MAG TPA: hypothetical protein PL017_03355 [Tenuifilaceae bacterium]|nr:hypothetical protein [Tenuifilaceae bacterium]HPE18888.1 hypothetical protein [Tenuifilaceae bacterium]HPJ45109.1 hypothetical protein [Tenuifilaceae bacterium]HPQ33709.1 hypothetical protein [Tenuifilaceae bacterium]HRX68070.1 hypothetical protein [Tenuifilaceae bacterium]